MPIGRKSSRRRRTPAEVPRAVSSDPATANRPLIVCGDINDGPGLDASERRLFGSGIERLMGIIWRPQFCFGNALFDTLKPKDKEELDFSSIHTTSFKDPIFNGVYQKEWIDHILYSRSGRRVGNGRAGAHEDARRLGYLYEVQARIGSLSGFRRRHDMTFFE